MISRRLAAFLALAFPIALLGGAPNPNPTIAIASPAQNQVIGYPLPASPPTITVKAVGTLEQGQAITGSIDPANGLPGTPLKFQGTSASYPDKLAEGKHLIAIDARFTVPPYLTQSATPGSPGSQKQPPAGKPGESPYPNLKNNPPPAHYSTEKQLGDECDFTVQDARLAFSQSPIKVWVGGPPATVQLEEVGFPRSTTFAILPVPVEGVATPVATPAPASGPLQVSGAAPAGQPNGSVTVTVSAGQNTGVVRLVAEHRDAQNPTFDGDALVYVNPGLTSLGSSSIQWAPVAADATISAQGAGFDSLTKMQLTPAGATGGTPLATLPGDAGRLSFVVPASQAPGSYTVAATENLDTPGSPVAVLLASLGLPLTVQAPPQFVIAPPAGAAVAADGSVQLMIGDAPVFSVTGPAAGYPSPIAAVVHPSSGILGSDQTVPVSAGSPASVGVTALSAGVASLAVAGPNGAGSNAEKLAVHGFTLAASAASVAQGSSVTLSIGGNMTKAAEKVTLVLTGVGGSPASAASLASTTATVAPQGTATVALTANAAGTVQVRVFAGPSGTLAASSPIQVQVNAGSTTTTTAATPPTVTQVNPTPTNWAAPDANPLEVDVIGTNFTQVQSVQIEGIQVDFNNGTLVPTSPDFATAFTVDSPQKVHFTMVRAGPAANPYWTLPGGNGQFYSGSFIQVTVTTVGGSASGQNALP